MQKLIEGLRRFRDHVLWEKQELFERSTRGQHPLAMLICCSDSRVLPESLLQADPGDLFVSRNAGNLVPHPDAHSGEAATIEYAVVALGVRDIVVCGHYRCGAVRALLDTNGLQQLPLMAEWLEHASETRKAIEVARPQMHDDTELWDKAVEQNVLVQVKNLERHPSVADGLVAGKLRIHAWVLRFETGEVMAYAPQSGEFQPLLDMSDIQAALGWRGKEEAATSEVPAVAQENVAAVNAAQGNGAATLSWLEILKSDLPASLVVFMVALPLCIAIAKACGVPPEAGLITGIIGGAMGLIAGSPLQVSGPAAGLIVILLDIVHDQGIAALGVIVALAGLMQIAAAALKLGQWFRAISPAVIVGMLAGIGGVIFAQQFHVMVDDAPERSPVMNFLNISRSIYLGLANDPNLPPEHRPAALVGMLTLAILLTWKSFAPRRLRCIPGILVAVVAATTIATLFDLPIQRVDFDHLSIGIQWLKVSSLPGLLAEPAIWIGAITVAVIASAETLLCATAVDQIHHGPRTRYDQELAAQGIGNALCGVLGTLPMTGVIVRSSANVYAGARTRWSAVFHGVWLLVFVLFFPGVVRLIPTSCLAAILVLTGLKLIEVHTLRELWKESRGEAFIAIATGVTVVFADLLTGVLLGVALSVVKLILMVSRLRIVRREDAAHNRVTLVLHGSATFLRLPKLAAALEEIAPGVTVHVDLQSLDYIDHACLTLLVNWEKQHAASGGQLTLDWDVLRARFQRVKHLEPKRRRKILTV